MKIRNILILMIMLFFSIKLLANDIIISSAKMELERSMNELTLEKIKPYFISYTITDVKSNTISASFGKIRNTDNSHKRFLDIDLRVGNNKLDNTHIIRGNPFSFSFGGGSISMPLDDNEKAIRNALWFATDKRFKSAIERYEKVITNKAVKVAEEDSSFDFTIEKPVNYTGTEINFTTDTKKWEDILRRLSDKFNAHQWIYNANISMLTSIQTKRFVSSEGSTIKDWESNCRIYVTAQTKSDDGMTLPLYETYFSFTPENLPTEDKIAADIDKMIALLDNLRKAPLATTFSGPAILSGPASGVFFHEIFGHRVEGHREKDPNSSQTFKQSIGKKILPDFINVIFDPTIKKLNGQEVAGYYVFDNEGIKSQKVETVKNGIFQNFLMSRSPIEGFNNSNGHGRAQAGYTPVSRQSNLIVEAVKSVPEKKLREMLIDEAKKQNKEYGLYFDQVSGGFTFTDRTIPNAFNVTPLVVYKVYVDDRPDELVRGVDLIGTPLTTFSNIIAAADDIGIFNGICGAESGGVPVSASSPSLLVSLIEVQKKQKSQAKPPLLPSPLSTKAD